LPLATADRAWAEELAGDLTSELRARHEQPAARLIVDARGLFQQGRRDDGFAKAKEVVDKYYASPSYRLTRKWLAERQ
jgi:hypothetical protein